jgi:hypothetical protein
LMWLKWMRTSSKIVRWREVGFTKIISWRSKKSVPRSTKMCDPSDPRDFCKIDWKSDPSHCFGQFLGRALWGLELQKIEQNGSEWMALLLKIMIYDEGNTRSEIRSITAIGWVGFNHFPRVL